MGEYLNRVTLIGRLGHDPEFRSTSGGRPLATLSVVTSETWEKEGQREERATWHRVVVFADPLVTYARDWLSKATSVNEV
jgi:single-strand DNA-binding protein